jgi:8-oxo-dGTP pyrophosphatase MutT (NUDIX family)
MNSALPKKRLIAHVLMRDVRDRVLLCETQFKKDWELPGGIVEPLEPPRLGAAREVAEELGIELEIGRLLVVDWMPPLAFRRLSIAVALGSDETAYIEDGRTP